MITPSQTVGPFFAIGLPALEIPDDTTDLVWLRGRVLDGAGEPVPDAVVEAWQPEPARFARASTDAAGMWAVRLHDGGTATLSLFARGLLNRLVTRVYLTDAEAAADPVLSGLDDARRATLVAARTADGYAFDIHLQGPHETVFFRL
jgi:protocatechuate 3,4-dioxygenase, alpha subunit